MALVDEPKAVGEIFNIGGDDEVSINDLAERVKRAANSASPISHIPYSQAYQEGFEDMQRRVPDLTRMRKLTGYRNRYDLDSILARVVEYERTR
jgi:UDP-glucose 4-epimerase